LLNEINIEDFIKLLKVTSKKMFKMPVVRRSRNIRMRILRRSFVQSEMHLHGISLLGMDTQHLPPDTAVVLNGDFASGIKGIFTIGEKFFEMHWHSASK
jgi:hypothetical protein